MRKRRGRRWLLPIVLWASLIGREGMTQTISLPPRWMIGRRHHPRVIGRPHPDTEVRPAPPPGPAADPRPGGGRPARRAGWMRTIPPGAADQPGDGHAAGGGPAARHRRGDGAGRAGARAPAPGQGPLDPEPQRRASTTSGTTASSRTSSRGLISSKGRQSLFAGGGPSLAVGLDRRHLRPAGGAAGGRRARPTSRPRGTTASCTVAQAFFDLQAARGRLLGVGASIARAELLVKFATGLAPSLIAPLEINRAQTELQSLRQTQQVAIRDWRVASARLAEILLLEPGDLLEPIEPPFLQVTLVPADCIDRGS